MGAQQHALELQHALVSFSMCSSTEVCPPGPLSGQQTPHGVPRKLFLHAQNCSQKFAAALDACRS
eukprot:8761506-Alexandrium_andersonii.AAC.1